VANEADTTLSSVCCYGHEGHLEWLWRGDSCPVRDFFVIRGGQSICAVSAPDICPRAFAERPQGNTLSKSQAVYDQQESRDNNT